MKPTLPYRLTRALLAEMASGNYQAGRKFFSHRQIMQEWKVSTPTAAKALQTLVDMKVLEVADRSGHYIAGGFREQALLGLNQFGERTAHPLPLRRSAWQARVRSSIQGTNRLQRIVVVIVLSEDRPIVQPNGDTEIVSDFASTRTARGIFNEATKHGVVVDFFVDNGEPEVERAIVEQVMGSNAQAAVIIRRIFSAKIANLASMLLAKWMPVVGVFDDCEQTRMVSVNFNNIGIGHKVASAFIRKGHRKIGVLLRPSRHGSYFWDRLRGCELAAMESGNCRVTGIFAEEKATVLKRACRKLRKSGVTALLVAGEELLVAIRPYLEEAGIRIPDDLSIAICSSSPMVEGFSHPFDLVRMNFEEMGQTAFQAACRYFEGETPFRAILIDPPLETHGTVRAPKG